MKTSLIALLFVSSFSTAFASDTYSGEKILDYVKTGTHKNKAKDCMVQVESSGGTVYVTVWDKDENFAAFNNTLLEHVDIVEKAEDANYSAAFTGLRF